MTFIKTVFKTLTGALFASGLALTLMAGTANQANAAETIRVATDATFPPFEYTKDGKRTGFDIELIEALAKQMGATVQWVDIDFKGLIPGLIAHRFDVAASAIYMTPERRQVVNFTEPYYKGGLAVLVKDDSPIKVPADLAGKKVSVQVGTKSVAFLKDNYPQTARIEVEKNQEMFDLVKIGRADAAVTGRPAAATYAKSEKTMRVLDKGLTTELYGYALRKDESALTARMNQALDALKANGTYSALVTKWFGE